MSKGLNQFYFSQKQKNTYMQMQNMGHEHIPTFVKVGDDWIEYTEWSSKGYSHTDHFGDAVLIYEGEEVETRYGNK